MTSSNSPETPDGSLKPSRDLEAGFVEQISTNSSASGTVAADQDAVREKDEDAPPVQQHDDRFVVDWEPADDPINPTKWPPARQWLTIGVLSFITFLTYDPLRLLHGSSKSLTMLQPFSIFHVCAGRPIGHAGF